MDTTSDSSTLVPPTPAPAPQPYRPPNPRQLTKALRRASEYNPEARCSKNEEGLRRDDINGLQPSYSAGTPPGEPEDIRSTLSLSLSSSWWPSGPKWKRYFLQEVAGDKYLESQLLLMTVSTGVMDVMTYVVYGVFCSKMTGNVMLLTLAAMPHVDSVPRDGVAANAAMALGCFALGALLHGHLGHISRQRARVWLLASNLFQALLALAAAAVRYFTPRRDGTGPEALVIVALLSFAAAGQIATALNVNLPEINTTMITGALIQLFTDRQLLHLRNPRRNRRLAFLAAMLLGGFIGSAALGSYSPSFVLVVVAVLKGALVFTFFFNMGIVVKPVPSGSDGATTTQGTATPAKHVLFGE